MTPILWRMTDSEIVKLLTDARAEQQRLYQQYYLYLGRRGNDRELMRNPYVAPERRQDYRSEYDELTERVNRLQDRIAAQRTFVVAVEREFVERGLAPLTRAQQVHYEDKHRRR